MGDWLFERAGALRPAYEAVDWAATPLGPTCDWPQALRGTLLLALQSRFPISLFWGDEQVLLYNEAYVRLIEDKHPQGLGNTVARVFPEILDVIGPLISQVRTEGRAVYVEDLPLLMDRAGFREECYFTFSYSPVPGELPGEVVGVMNIATETTRQVLEIGRAHV